MKHHHIAKAGTCFHEIRMIPVGCGQLQSTCLTTLLHTVYSILEATVARYTSSNDDDGIVWRDNT